MKSLAIHSHKGGVGKSTISVNIAVELAKSSNVLVIDNDLAGPSMQTYFTRQASYFNEYLSQEETLQNCINKYEDDKLQGNLYYALSNPSQETVDSLLRIDKKMATKMLRQLINMKKILVEEYDIDYLIIDTSPGINITSANAFIATDNILFVNKLSNADIEGSAYMISGILEYMDNNAYMIANQIPPSKLDDENERNRLMNLIQNHLNNRIGKDIIEMVGILPMDFDLQIHEYEAAQETMQGIENHHKGRSNRHIYALDDPDNTFLCFLRQTINTVFG